jgi:hypothetical protein
LTSAISSGILHLTENSCGLAIRIARHFAREIATFNRFLLNKTPTRLSPSDSKRFVALVKIMEKALTQVPAS